jgi:glycosyltransferase involved in cell wall biosynthesis
MSSADRAPEERPEAMRPPGRHATVLHVTTVASTLRFLHGQTSFIRRAGFDVHAVSSPGPELAAFAEKEGVAVHAVEMTRRMTPLRDLRALLRLRKVLRRVRPDIVHGHTPKGGLLAMLAGWLAGTPVRIYHLRGLPLLTASGTRRRILRLTEAVSCGLAHRVIAVSHSMRSEAIRERLCAPDRIKVLLGGSGNGVDAEGRFRPLGDVVRRETRARHGIPEDALVVGFVGRIVREKGVAELATAWMGLRERYAGLHLLLVGVLEPEDPLPPGVVRLLHSDPRVHLVGLDWDTPRLYAAMDVVALPTYREGFPNVPLEAAAMALPVVATRVPGCVDAVQDGTTGLLVPPRDADALARALDRYLASPTLRATHGAAARRRVLADFRQEAVWLAVEQEYRELLARAGGRGATSPSNAEASPSGE